MPAVRLLLTAWLVVVGCDSTPTPEDASADRDAGVPSDAAPADSALPDGGRSDAGAADGGGGDGGIVVNGIRGGNDGNPNGNVDPDFAPDPADYVYVDLNAAVDGDGRTAATPTNVLPRTIGDRTQLLFNSDSGPHRAPCRDDAVFVAGSDIQVSSYGSGRATVSAYEVVTDGWTRVGTSDVWRRKHVRSRTSAGPVIGNVVDATSTADSPNGDVLGWENLEAVGGRNTAFRSAPEGLASGRYAFDWADAEQYVYVNVGGDPNGRELGIACVGRFLTSQGRASTTERVAVHHLRIEGFARAAVNLRGTAVDWHVYDNVLYANGGMYNISAGWYHGSGIQMTHFARGIEINNNRIIDTYDSPITPQHFGGDSDGHVEDVHAHHNFIDRWALAAFELVDWGGGVGRFSRITFEDNVAVHGGEGFSRAGDSPLGYTDGVHVRGNPRGQITALAILRNEIDALDTNILVNSSNFDDAIRIEENSLSDARIGVRNTRSAVRLSVIDNRMCGHETDVDNANTASEVRGTYCDR